MRVIFIILLTINSFSLFAQLDWKYTNEKFVDSETNHELKGHRHINYNDYVGTVKFENGNVISCNIRKKGVPIDRKLELEDLKFSQFAQYLYQGYIETNVNTIVTPLPTFRSDDKIKIMWNSPWDYQTINFKLKNFYGEIILTVETSGNFVSIDSSNINSYKKDVIIEISNDNYKQELLFRNFKKLSNDEINKLNIEIEKIESVKDSDEFKIEKARLLLKYRCYTDSFIIYQDLIAKAKNPLNYKLLFWLDTMKYYSPSGNYQKQFIRD